MDRPNTAHVRFYHDNGSRRIPPLGSYDEIDHLPAPSWLPPFLGDVGPVLIIKEIDLPSAAVRWLLPGRNAIYDGTTLYVHGATYESAFAFYLQVLTWLHRDSVSSSGQGGGMGG